MSPAPARKKSGLRSGHTLAWRARELEEGQALTGRSQLVDRGLMCRSLISVSWDGRLFDCDFNQMIGLRLDEQAPRTIFELDLGALAGRRIRTADHCLGCTAGVGSSCGGARVAPRR